jgi:hypothetical protein
MVQLSTAQQIERAAGILHGLAFDAENLRSHAAVERLIDGLESVSSDVRAIARGVPRQR